jgi:hypothetical protein
MMGVTQSGQKIMVSAVSEHNTELPSAVQKILIIIRLRDPIEQWRLTAAGLIHEVLVILPAVGEEAGAEEDEMTLYTDHVRLDLEVLAARCGVEGLGTNGR